MTNPPTSASAPSASRRRRWLKIAIALVLLIALAEFASRWLLVRLDERTAIDPAILNDYQTVDPREPRNWVLKAGYTQTIQQLIDASRQAGKIAVVKLYEEKLARNEVRPDDLYIAINKAGFHGPELDPTHARPRVLFLGDSTAGEIPKLCGDALKAAGRDVEMVNGSVDGYSPRNYNFRIDDYKALKPQVVVLYTGWNGLYQMSECEFFGPVLRPVKTLRVAKLALGRLQRWWNPDTATIKKADSSASALALAEDYVPTFMSEIEKTIDALEGAGAKVVLVSLPGLYMSGEEPTARALEIGHLPVWTDNPLVFAKMTERYNEALRAVAQRRKLVWIDVAGWSREALKPRDAFFADSVHVQREGQGRIAEQLAKELAPLLSER